MSLCNFCKFRQLKRRTDEKGLTITKKRGTWGMGGVEVYVHPKGVVIENGAAEEDHPQKIYWKCWYMELPDSCCC